MKNHLVFTILFFGCINLIAQNKWTIGVASTSTLEYAKSFIQNSHDKEQLSIKKITNSKYWVNYGRYNNYNDAKRALKSIDYKGAYVRKINENLKIANKTYTIGLSSAKDRKNAISFIEEHPDLDPEIISIDFVNGYYRVNYGVFDDYSVAKEQLSFLKINGAYIRKKQTSFQEIGDLAEEKDTIIYTTKEESSNKVEPTHPMAYFNQNKPQSTTPIKPYQQEEEATRPHLIQKENNYSTYQEPAYKTPSNEEYDLVHVSNKKPRYTNNNTLRKKEKENNYSTYQEPAYKTPSNEEYDLVHVSDKKPRYTNNNTLRKKEYELVHVNNSNPYHFGIGIQAYSAKNDTNIKAGTSSNTIQLKTNSLKKIVPTFYFKNQNHKGSISYDQHSSNGSNIINGDTTINGYTYTDGQTINSHEKNTLLDIGYRYNFDGYNIGADIIQYENQIELSDANNSTNINSDYTIYALALDKEHDINDYIFSYGLKYGKGSNISMIDYYFAAGLKNIYLQGNSLSIGYHSRNIDISDNIESDTNGFYINYIQEF